jgi:hypothetical protein
MKTGVRIAVCFLLSCCICTAAEALLATVSREEAEDALRQGREKGDRVSEYINRAYGFGEEERFGEHGIVRTKWSKLMVLAGLLAIKGGKPSEAELTGILTSTDLQVDLHAFGDRAGFANAYTAYMIQGGRRIDPEKIAVDDIAYPAGDGVAASGFPRYRATIRSYFLYDKITPAGRIEIVLVKNRKRISFEVDLANYK